jgi:vacuolar-type H+-ATPase subunit C/Vma6
MRSRFQIENIKVLLRGFLNHTPLAALEEHLVPLAIPRVTFHADAPGVPAGCCAP